jgi:hypothetical protein
MLRVTSLVTVALAALLLPLPALLLLLALLSALATLLVLLALAVAVVLVLILIGHRSILSSVAGDGRDALTSRDQTWRRAPGFLMRGPDLTQCVEQ